MTTSISTQAASRARASASQKRGCLFYVKRGLKCFGIILVTLIALGVAYQTIATEMDKRNYSPRGQLYTVNGHQMHIVCTGEGSPTVILQAGGGGESLWWYRVQRQLTPHTQVCAYDRAGLGWSEAASTPRDPITTAGELHALLEEAGVQPPYIMAGHSYGGILARVYGWQYPQESAGLVLVDSLTVGLVDQSEIDNTSLVYYGALAPVWLMQRMGVTRFTATNNFQITGFPPENIPEMAALHSHNQTLDTDITEQGLPGYLALSQASFAASDLGDLPMTVLWSAASDATYNRDSMDEVAAYSSNSAVRVIEGSNHFSILGTEEYAQQVSDAILDVIDAAQTGEPLAQ